MSTDSRTLMTQGHRSHIEEIAGHRKRCLMALRAIRSSDIDPNRTPVGSGGPAPPRELHAAVLGLFDLIQPWSDQLEPEWSEVHLGAMTVPEPPLQDRPPRPGAPPGGNTGTRQDDVWGLSALDEWSFRTIEVQSHPSRPGGPHTSAERRLYLAPKVAEQAYREFMKALVDLGLGADVKSASEESEMDYEDLI